MFVKTFFDDIVKRLCQKFAGYVRAEAPHAASVFIFLYAILFRVFKFPLDSQKLSCM